MDWIKITETTRPEFEQQVFLIEVGEKESHISLGSLKSIDKNGLNWKIGNNGSDDIFKLFSGMSQINSSFNPTHYCIPTLPSIV